MQYYEATNDRKKERWNGSARKRWIYGWGKRSRGEQQEMKEMDIGEREESGGEQQEMKEMDIGERGGEQQEMKGERE